MELTPLPTTPGQISNGVPGAQLPASFVGRHPFMTGTGMCVAGGAALLALNELYQFVKAKIKGSDDSPAEGSAAFIAAVDTELARQVQARRNSELTAAYEAASSKMVEEQLGDLTTAIKRRLSADETLKNQRAVSAERLSDANKQIVDLQAKLDAANKPTPAAQLPDSTGASAPATEVQPIRLAEEAKA